MILLYLTHGKSFRLTSALMRLGTKTQVSDVAIIKRMRKSALWLKWLCQHICRRAGLLVEKPLWLKDKQVILVDGSEKVKAGAQPAHSRLHYGLDLFTLSMREFLLTDQKTGEKLSNFTKFQEGDVVMGDRIFGTLQGIAYIKSQKVDYVLRMRAKAFNLYDSQRQKLDLLALLAPLQEGEYADISAYCLLDKDHYELVRICVWRKDKANEEEGMKRLTKTNKEKQRGESSALQQEYNKYVVVISSLGKEASSVQILELCRLRWQIELAFKRLKSIYDYDDLPMKHHDSVLAFFYGKLLLAALCEALVNTGRFSP